MNTKPTIMIAKGIPNQINGMFYANIKKLTASSGCSRMAVGYYKATHWFAGSAPQYFLTKKEAVAWLRSVIAIEPSFTEYHS